MNDVKYIGLKLAYRCGGRALPRSVRTGASERSTGHPEGNALICRAKECGTNGFETLISLPAARRSAIISEAVNCWV
jgi:hypothetical protein